MQREALLWLFSEDNVKHKLRVIQPTGGRESHIATMMGLALREVHLIVHPLLVLSADQVSKISNLLHTYGSIVAINLDGQAATKHALQSIIDSVNSLAKKQQLLFSFLVLLSS